VVELTVYGIIDPNPKCGSIHRRMAISESKTAPDADTTITAGGTANISISIGGESPRNILYAGVESISGLPTDVYIAGISVDKSAKTLTITLVNTGAADVTISAGSLSLTIVVIS